MRILKRNLGTLARVARGAAATGLLVCAVVAPLSLGVRLAGFGVVGLYLAVTALFGRCGGYSLMGLSTCAPDRRAGRDGAGLGPISP
jgi:hypothetical protein